MKVGTLARPTGDSNATPAAPLPRTPGAPAAVFPHPATTQKAKPSQPNVSMAAAQQAAAEINKFLKSSSASVEFTVEGKTDRVIVRVVDSATHQVIRQIPSEETLAISRSLDRMAGLLVEQKA